MSKPQSTFVPRWEDVQDDLEPNLRRLLMQKKEKERSARPGIQTLDGRIVYKL